MKLRHPSSTRLCLWSCFAVVLVLALAEYAAYPSLATAINRAIGDGQSPDSSMGYFRDVQIGRSLIVFAIAALGALALAASRGHRALHATLAVLVAVDGLLLVGSALWYFRTVAAAAGAVSR